MNKLKCFLTLSMVGVGLLQAVIVCAQSCPRPNQVVSSQGKWQGVPGWIISQSVGSPGRGGAELQTVWIGSIVDVGAASFARPDGNFGVTCVYAGVSVASSLNLVKFAQVKPSGKWVIFSGRNVYCSVNGSNVSACSWR